MDLNARLSHPDRLAAAAGPFRRADLLARVTLFAMIAVVAEASVALPPRSGSVPAITASVALLAAAGLGVLLRWDRLPAWLAVSVPLTYAGSGLALNLAGGPNSGVGLVLLIPVIWCALFHRWGESAVVAARSCAT
jgi:hypothetical protein